MKAGLNQTQIANIVGVHKSTISRVLNRNRGQRGYGPKQAHKCCVQRCLHKSQPRIAQTTWHLIEHLLREQWSPEKISLWLHQHADITVSHEWIYQYVLADKQAGGSLYRNLRCKKQRKKRYGVYSRRGFITNAISIEERPAIVDTRCRFDGWELDMVTGKNYHHALVTLVERKSKLTLIAKVASKMAEAVSKAIIHLLNPLHLGCIH